MLSRQKLNKLYKNAARIPISSRSRIVLMSDCHRGAGTWNDNFMKNQSVFFAALSYYYDHGYTYIELGDGDELWENRSFPSIVCMHSDAFWLMAEFYKKKRFYMIYGNHDMVKRKPDFTMGKCRTFYDESLQKAAPLFPGIEIPEAYVLHHQDLPLDIFLVHGHQGDLLNDTLWPLSRFLVRYVWKPLELAGFHDPTSSAKNYIKKEAAEQRLTSFCEKKHTILIAGHTHRPVFPLPGQGLYFNDGSCVHPRCITAVEIADGAISLVKWTVMTRRDLSLFVGREILSGPVLLEKYVNN